MKWIHTCLLLCFAFGVILSCAIAPQEQVPETRFLRADLGEQKNIRLHALYKVPRRIPLGPSIPLGVAEGLDAEKVRKSIVQVIDSEGPQGSGFFVAPNKIATAIHVVTRADLDTLRVRSGDTDYAIQGVIAYDAQNDLVVLKVSGEGVPLALGNSEAVRRGDTVFSVGYSLDRYNVVKNSVDSLQGSGTCIEVTPHIVPGSSGGPMLNTEGEVIGMNVGGSGFSGYAIVSNALKILLVGSGTPESVGQWEQRGSVRAYVVLGEAHKAFSAGDYANAIATFNKGIALNPTYSRTYVGIVPTYYNRGYAKMY
ncbi:MAG: trypsin-like peptidase domain-containing protein, partial [Candidatus Poribacteria bacterium]|nr:trypsin-like peptidase domain-containing protein [Candidatus Poribacteria bacterium]